ncbi:MAG: glycosyltransferase family 2 protein [Planctomycetes bacterium]|nr:glycosyltransferase family 2 protein [Planctomycetota bacterium]
MTRVAVIIPTYDHGMLLKLSVGSVLAQTVPGIAIHVIGDGVTDAARAVIVGLVAEHGVHFHDHPKSPRTGEPYRHQLLGTLDADRIFYLSDDDLWLPDHVESLLPLLERNDLVAAVSAWVQADGQVKPMLHDLGKPFYRERIVAGDNHLPLSAAAHRMDAYRRLPHGWRTAPVGTATDLHMWQQWMPATPRTASGTTVTMLRFPSKMRADWPLERRYAEQERWAAALATGDGRARLHAACFAHARSTYIARDLAVRRLEEGMIGAVCALPRRPIT